MGALDSGAVATTKANYDRKVQAAVNALDGFKDVWPGRCGEGSQTVAGI
jgi:hypothetical protein